MHSLAKPTPHSWLSWFARGVLLLAIAILFGRLFEVQVIKGSYYQSLADNNRIRRVNIASPRGKIFARGGEVLVSNSEVKKRIVFDPEEGYVKEKVESESPGDEVITEWQREYLLGMDLAHVTGYLGEAKEGEAGKVDPGCPQKGPTSLGSLVGRTGLEEYYNCTLKGIDGQELVEVDTTGQKVRVLGRKSPESGQDIRTTIDYDLQKKVASLMQEELSYENGTVLPENRQGAVVVTDTKGEILALYSSPSFDPNLFVKNRTENKEEIASLLEDESLPFYNRAVSGAYHPGSVFKPITAIAALEESKIDENYTYTDEGFIKINEYTYNNWYFTQYGGTEGSISLARALARSTDTFFYKLGEFLGVENLVYWSKKFGLGEITGIDLPSESKGLVPDPKWKRLHKKEGWFLGNTYHMSIGQGDLTTTPIQINSVTSAIASGGKLCTPHIREGENNCINLGIDRQNLKDVIEGMKQACQPEGTAFPFFDFEPVVACKTGTAETNEEDKTHAWFTVFGPVSSSDGPAENPEIVVTVFVEKGGEGSYVAAPIAREILDYYFNGDSNNAESQN